MKSPLFVTHIIQLCTYRCIYYRIFEFGTKNQLIDCALPFSLSLRLSLPSLPLLPSLSSSLSVSPSPALPSPIHLSLPSHLYLSSSPPPPLSLPLSGIALHLHCYLFFDYPVLFASPVLESVEQVIPVAAVSFSLPHWPICFHQSFEGRMYGSFSLTSKLAR